MDASTKDPLTVRAGDTVRVPVHFEVSTSSGLQQAASALWASFLPGSFLAPSQGPALVLEIRVVRQPVWLEAQVAGFKF